MVNVPMPICSFQLCDVYRIGKSGKEFMYTELQQVMQIGSSRELMGSSRLSDSELDYFHNIAPQEMRVPYIGVQNV